MNEKLYITKKDIVEAYKSDKLQELFNEKIELLQQVEKQKQAKKDLLEMLKSPSKLEMILKMLEQSSK